jgi:cellulose synthase (UDP-forming)
MFILQELCLRVISRGTISLKWSGIYETSVMPYLLIPILKESLGLSLSVFAVTDKSGRATVDKKKFKTMLPLLILLALSLFGIVRVILLMKTIPVMNLIVLLFWIVRNTYFIAMSIFLIDGRYGNEETVNVKDAEFVTLKNKQDDGETRTFDGVTTYLNEHSVKVFLDEDEGLKIGDKLELTIENELYDASLQTILTGIQESRSGKKKVFSLEIVDYGSSWNEYEMILFDRTPSLPQSLTRDYGIVFHLLSNIAHRVLQHE